MQVGTGKGRVGIPPEPFEPRIAGHVAAWCFSKSPDTRRGYTDSLRAFQRSIGARSILDATETDYIAFLDAIDARGLASSSFNRHVAALKSFLNFLMERGALASNPGRWILQQRKIRDELTIERILTVEEVQKLIDARPPAARGPDAKVVEFVRCRRAEGLGCRKISQALHKAGFPGWTGRPSEDKRVCQLYKVADTGPMADRIQTRNSLMLKVLFFAGLRASELCAMQWSHVTLNPKKQGKIHVFGKGSKNGQVSIPFGLYEELQKFRDHDRVERFVFTRERRDSRLSGKPLTTRHLRRLVIDRARWSGLLADDRNISPHWFRHACLNTMVQNGANPRLVQKHARHSSLSVTERYLHLHETDDAPRFLPGLGVAV